jgi:hypothetical protein
MLSPQVAALCLMVGGMVVALVVDVVMVVMVLVRGQVVTDSRGVCWFQDQQGRGE